MTKDRVLRALLENEGRYVSGGELAGRLSLSRTAVWKAVEALRREGWAVSSAPKRGYRLDAGGEALSESGITARLRHRELEVRVYKSLSSTNTALKQLAEQGAEAGLVLAAEEQTAGKGRMGRSFYSPARTGLYMSLLLRPKLPAAEAVSITACAAVAVAEAIEALTGRAAAIKWVNDVLLDGKKVCGILTEGALDCETGRFQYAVLGVGVNVSPPEEGFPAELAPLAGAIAEGGREGLRCRLGAEILDRFMDLYAALPEQSCLAAYKKRSCLLGQEVELVMPGREREPVTVLDIAPDFSLIVRDGDGRQRAVRSGEVSVRPIC